MQAMQDVQEAEGGEGRSKGRKPKFILRLARWYAQLALVLDLLYLVFGMETSPRIPGNAEPPRTYARRWDCPSGVKASRR